MAVKGGNSGIGGGGGGGAAQRPENAGDQSAQNERFTPKMALSSPEATLAYLEQAENQDAIQSLYDTLQEVPVDSRQQDDDITRLFNAWGWTERTPELLDEDSFAQAWLQAKRPKRLYHSDEPYNGIEPEEFARQLMGKVDGQRHYLSNGIFGNGTYFSTKAGEAFGYGPSQVHAFLNSKAKVAHADIINEFDAYEKSHPRVASFFYKLYGGYGGWDDKEGSVSVYAAMRGYNVIWDGHTFFSVFDRSALTMSEKIATKKNVFNHEWW